MSERTIHDLDARGTVRDWLLAGPWTDPVADLDDHLDADSDPFGPRGRWVLTNGPDAAALKRRLAAAHPLPTEAPSDPSEGAEVAWAGRRGRWRRARAGEDGLLDTSAFCFTPTYRLQLAGVLLEVDQADRRRLVVASTGPTAVFVDGELIDTDATVTYMEPAERELVVDLPSRTTPVVVASWNVGFREVRQVLRLRICGLPARVIVPSPGADPRAARLAEQALDALAFPRWGADQPTAPVAGIDGTALRVSGPRGREVIDLAGGLATLALAPAEEDRDEPLTASMLATGERHLTLRVDRDDAPVGREAALAWLPEDYVAEPRGEPDQWQAALLAHAGDRTGSAAAELARVVQGAGHVRPEGLEQALTSVTQRADCADFELLGLLHLWHRCPAPAWDDKLRAQVADAVTGFRFWLDQPGLDCMCFFTENHQLVFHSAEALAGEAFADATFGNAGISGQAHAELGRSRCRDWIGRRLRGGFSEFDSNAYLAIDLLALVSLVEFSRDRDLAALAEALADKILFSLATNSWRGIHGSSHGRSYAQTLRSGRLEETAPLQRIAWGMGTLNDALLPATVLATAQRYAIPAAVRAAGAHIPDAWWGLQRYQGTYRFDRDLLEREWESAAVVWRTPDVMLASVQDYRCGLPGLQEHVWGATLGPETHVFVTHPANSATHSAARPNYWAGNRILPRARQDRDALIALYRIGVDDPMRFTHAWFPTCHMDDWRESDGWFVGRRGGGYVAVTADVPLRLLERGENARQELRPDGPGTAWVCQVGRAATHGSFAAFTASLRRPCFGDQVRYDTPDERHLELGWDTGWRVDGRPQPIEDFPHLRNPFTHTPMGAPTMRIRVGDLVHELDLAAGRRVGQEQRTMARGRKDAN
ncbi:hypothetical protein BH20ACT8_BH20ACT8_01580 [soil metagenome]